MDEQDTQKLVSGSTASKPISQLQQQPVCIEAM